MDTEPIPGCEAFGCFKQAEDEPETPIPKGYPPLGRGKQILGLLVGSRGSGKTTWLLHFLTKYLERKSFERVFIVSPTNARDRKVRAVLKEHIESGVVDLSEDFDFETVRDELEAVNDMYTVNEEYKAVWKRFLKMSDDEVLTMDPRDLQLLELHEFKPPRKYSHPPSCMLVFDDCLGDRSIFKPSIDGPFMKFLIAHRHYRCSVMFSVQSWTHTLPPSIKSNFNLYVLWAQRDRKIKKAVAEAISSHIDPETLERLWEGATAKPYTPFVMSFDTPDAVFRQGMDRRIKTA